MQTKILNKRHGDLSLFPIKKLPKGLTTVKHTGSFVVALGSTSGHRHVLSVSNKKNMEIYKDKDGRFYFKFSTLAKYTHEEHKELVIEKGIYADVRERESDHFEQSIVRQVVD
jgi:hypothetical protein